MVKKLKLGKAVGIDNIILEMLKNRRKVEIWILELLFNNVIREST